MAPGGTEKRKPSTPPPKSGKQPTTPVSTPNIRPKTSPSAVPKFIAVIPTPAVNSQSQQRSQSLTPSRNGKSTVEQIRSKSAANGQRKSLVATMTAPSRSALPEATPLEIAAAPPPVLPQLGNENRMVSSDGQLPRRLYTTIFYERPITEKKLEPPIESEASEVHSEPKTENAEKAVKGEKTENVEKAPSSSFGVGVFSLPIQGLQKAFGAASKLFSKFTQREVESPSELKLAADTEKEKSASIDGAAPNVKKPTPTTSPLPTYPGSRLPRPVSQNGATASKSATSSSQTSSDKSASDKPTSALLQKRKELLSKMSAAVEKKHRSTSLEETPPVLYSNLRVSFSPEEEEMDQMPLDLGEYDILLPMPHFDRVLVEELAGFRVETAVHANVVRELERAAQIVYRSKRMESSGAAPTKYDVPPTPTSQSSESDLQYRFKSVVKHLVTETMGAVLGERPPAMQTMPMPMPKSSAESSRDTSIQSEPPPDISPSEIGVEKKASKRVVARYVAQYADAQPILTNRWKESSGTRAQEVGVAVSVVPAQCAEVEEAQSPENTKWSQLFDLAAESLRCTLKGVRERGLTREVVVHVSVPDLTDNNRSTPLVAVRAELMESSPTPLSSSIVPVPTPGPVRKVRQLRKIGDGSYVDAGIWAEKFMGKIKDLDVQFVEPKMVVVEKREIISEAEEVQVSTPESPPPSDASEKMIAKPLSDEVADYEMNQYPPMPSNEIDWAPISIPLLSVITEEKSEDMPSTASISSSIESASSKTTEITETSTSAVTTTTTAATSPAKSAASTVGVSSELGSVSVGKTGVRDFIRQMMHPLPSVRIETVDTTQSTARIDFVLLDQKGNITRICSSPKSGRDKPSEID